MATKVADKKQADQYNKRKAASNAHHKEERLAATTVVIPTPEDAERRELLESDDIEWLLYYFGDGCGLVDPFTYHFVGQQIQMITAIGEAMRNGRDQAIAASRGEGKTTIAERLALKYLLSGAANYIVLFASTGPMAENILDSINTYCRDNDRLLADYPEVCHPVRALEGVAQRAKTQRASGKRMDNGEVYEQAQVSYSWCGNELIFPNVPGSPSAGAIIATRGLDAAVRGLKKRGKRPQLAIVDDPDTEHTAISEEQAAKLEKRIDAAIGGLGGQRRSIGRVILTTLQSRTAVSYKLTDPQKKPTFKGRRYRFLVAPPTRSDLWDEYVAMRLDDMQQRDDKGVNLDPEGRRAHRFYLDNRDDMDAGAIIANEHRYDATPQPDGTLREASALEAYYNLVAKLGPEVVATEYDNDPPEEAAYVASGLNPTRIQRQCSGYERRIIPPGCTVLTCGIDVRKVALHWVVRAWAPDCSGYTIDYGVHEVHGTRYGSDDGVDEAIRKAILDFLELQRGAGYCTADGEIMPVDLTLVDSGWRTDAVYAACHEIGTGVMPIKGFGRSAGCAGANFSDINRRTTDKKPGDGWFLSRHGKLWLVCADADRWKAWEHDRWLTSPDKPGSMQIFGAGGTPGSRMTPDEKSHFSYARHICNESEEEYQDKRGGGLKRGWRTKSENTHWLDASYYANIAANIRGVKLQHAAPSRATPSTLANTAAATPEQQAAARPTPKAADASQSWFRQSTRRRT